METFKQLIRRRDEWNKLPEFNGRLHVTTRYYLRLSDGSELMLGSDKQKAIAKYNDYRNNGFVTMKLEQRPELTVWPDEPDTTVEWALNQNPWAAMAGAMLENLVFNEPIKQMEL